MRERLLTLFLAAVSLAWAAPAIRSGGVVNAASFRLPGTPGGGLAQGSLATAFGAGLGPAAGVSAGAYPLSTTLGGVSVRITQGSRTFDAYPVFVIEGQVNFLVPSTVPVGAAEVRVTYNGETSAAAPAQIVRSAPGIFTFSAGGSAQRAVAQNYVSASETPVNLPDASASPGQTLIVYGTGLGSISAPDNQAPPAGDLGAGAIEVLVGGAPARVSYAGRSPCCAGLDQIVFELPANTPVGCSTPLVVRAGDAYSNVGDISVSSRGGRCVEAITVGESGQVCLNGAGGQFTLYESFSQRLQAVEIPGISPNFVIASGAGYFVRVSGCAPVPALGLGSCSVSTRAVGANPASPSPQPTPELPTSTYTVTYLDAGSTLTLRTPAVEVPFLRSGVAYSGRFPPFSVSDPKPALTAGEYTFSSTGGRDLGAFSSTFSFAPLRLTSHSNGGNFDASQPPTLRWSGGEYARDYLNVSASLVDDRFVSTVQCLIAGGQAGSFTLPEWAWRQIPSFKTGYAYLSVFGASMLSPIPVKTAGLDLGVGFNMITGHQLQMNIR
jgi:uncharacterized protein (TIGR03437 family)